MIEQSNERGVVDLLSPTMNNTRNEASETTTIDNVDSYEVNSINDTLDLFTLGVKN